MPSKAIRIPFASGGEFSLQTRDQGRALYRAVALILEIHSRIGEADLIDAKRRSW